MNLSSRRYDATTIAWPNDCSRRCLIQLVVTNTRQVIVHAAHCSPCTNFPSSPYLISFIPFTQIGPVLHDRLPASFSTFAAPSATAPAPSRFASSALLRPYPNQLPSHAPQLCVSALALSYAALAFVSVSCSAPSTFAFAAS